MAPSLASVGVRIRNERVAAGLSLSKLSELTGLSKSYLVRLENDPGSNPSLEVLHRIADALDTTVADLVGTPKLSFSESNDEIPASLLAFADRARLTKRELRTLASIRWRKGDEPRTEERWRYILNSLRASRELDTQEDDAERH